MIPERRTAWLLPVVLVVCLARVAAAEPLWYQLYEEGLEMVAARRWSDALDRFERAAAQRPAPQARARMYGSRFLFSYDPPFQRARCLVELLRPEEAEQQLILAERARISGATELSALRARIEQALAERAAGEADASSGSSELRGLEADSSATLRVDSTPTGAEVRVDGRAVGVTPLAPRPIPAGSHVLELYRAGYERWREEISPASLELLHLDVALRRSDAPAESKRNISARVAPAVPTELPRELPVGTGGAVSSQAQPPQLATRRPDEPPTEAVARRMPSDERTSQPSLEDASVPASRQPQGRLGVTTGTGASPSARRGPWLVGAVAVLLLGLGWWLRGLRRRRRRETGLSHRIVGHYELLDELGRGGMATTYRARRRSDGKEVALKIPYESGDPNFQARFLREGRLGETLHHPGIVRILEAGEDAGTPFLAMELLPGHTLEEELLQHPQGLELERALSIVRAVAEALDYAHGKGVIHRDLKPANIMLLPDGALQVMDFGVARVIGQPGLTSSQHFFGSPLYAAPETIDAVSADHRADLYSLGVLLFELLQGRPPFVHESVFRVLEMHQRRALPTDSELSRPLPDAIWTLLHWLCAKRPQDRPDSAQVLLVELRALLHRPCGEMAGVSTPG